MVLEVAEDGCSSLHSGAKGLEKLLRPIPEDQLTDGK